MKHNAIIKRFVLMLFVCSIAAFVFYKSGSLDKDVVSLEEAIISDTSLPAIDTTRKTVYVKSAYIAWSVNNFHNFPKLSVFDIDTVRLIPKP